MAQIPSCKCGNPASKPDKFAKDVCCDGCFASRREGAAKAGHSEWFEANIPISEMTENEKVLTGLP